MIDRLGWWYTVPREWLKKVSLMDDVYLLNNPFTFQAMEKHSAYCAMMRLGLNVPETWLIPHKSPPANERFQPTAERYNLPFDLEEIAAKVGYPLYMKPFDGGQWVGVTRIRDATELHAVYDTSGERLMHLQASVEDFDVFARSLSIGAETMVMHFEPDRPMHDRYQVDHDFLSAETGDEVVTISRLVNAFFRWEFNSCETIVKDGVASPIDYANASPGRRAHEPALLLPLGDPRARPLDGVLLGDRAADADQPDDAGLLRGRRPRRPHLRGEARRVPAAGRRLLPGRRVRRVLRRRSCRTWTRSWSTGSRARTSTACSSTPSRRPSRQHEHEHFVAHYRGLLAAWAKDQRAAA